MRHRKAGSKLGRTTAHRTATLRNLAVSLFEHGQITTTIPRAKAVQPMVEKLITLAKTDSPSNRRRLIAKMGYDRLSFDWLYLPKNASDAEKDQVGAQRERAAAYFNVPEADYLRFKSLRGASNAGSPRTLDLSGSTIQIRMANGQLFDKNASTMVTVESEFNRETGNIEFRADFPNPDGLLRHGQTGTLLINQRVSGATVIPQRATFEILDRRYVYVVDEKEIAHQREIKVARELEDIYVLSGGLKPGEKFVLEGVRQVRDGKHLEHTETRAAKDAVKNLKFNAE